MIINYAIIKAPRKKIIISIDKILLAIVFYFKNGRSKFPFEPKSIQITGFGSIYCDFMRSKMNDYKKLRLEKLKQGDLWLGWQEPKIVKISCAGDGRFFKICGIYRGLTRGGIVQTLAEQSLR